MLLGGKVFSLLLGGSLPNNDRPLIPSPLLVDGMVAVRAIYSLLYLRIHPIGTPYTNRDRYLHYSFPYCVTRGLDPRGAHYNAHLDKFPYSYLFSMGIPGFSYSDSMSSQIQ